MARDRILKRTFETADDAIQAVIAYFYYVTICDRLSPLPRIANEVPLVVAFEPFGVRGHLPVTHRWSRQFDPVVLVRTMKDIFPAYHSRTCTLAVVALFEAALSAMLARLASRCGLRIGGFRTYKDRLRWAIPLILQSSYGSAEEQANRPMVCFDLDHARRLRNLWMHSNGRMQSFYLTDAILVPGAQPVTVPEYQEWRRHPRRRVVVQCSDGQFHQISRSHVEALHHLHDVLQRAHFGQKRSYSYRSARKRLEWRRMLGAM